MNEFIPTQNEDRPNQKNRWLVPLIIVLVLLLTAQTAAVLYYLYRQDQQKSFAQMAAPAGHAPVYSGSSSAYPRKSPASPYTRNFHKTYDPLFADALNSMSRLEDHFNQMLGQWMSSAPDMADFFGGADDFDFMPTVDLAETPEHYLVKVDLPGIDKNNIDITVRDELLTIRGVRQSETETKDDKSGVFKQERSYGSFARSLRLPGPVDDSAIAADYKNGVLTIKLPKAPSSAAEAKKIAIQ